MSLVVLFVEPYCEFIANEFGAQFILGACICICVYGLLSVSYNVLYSYWVSGPVASVT